MTAGLQKLTVTKRAAGAYAEPQSFVQFTFQSLLMRYFHTYLMQSSGYLSCVNAPHCSLRELTCTALDPINLEPGEFCLCDETSFQHDIGVIEWNVLRCFWSTSSISPCDVSQVIDVECVVKVVLSDERAGMCCDAFDTAYTQNRRVEVSACLVKLHTNAKQNRLNLQGGLPFLSALK